LKVNMSLLATQTSSSTPAFEQDEDTPQTAPQASTTASANLPAATTTTNNALAVKPSTDHPLAELKNALTVEFNTLSALILSNGNLLMREGKKSVGDSIQLELMSYQDSYVVAPNDDKAPVSVVRFSNDGIVCSDGVTSVKEHLQWLHTNGYPKASLKSRVIIVGAVEKCPKNAELIGTLVQIDLSPASRAQWLRYEANALYKFQKGLATKEGLRHIKVQAEIATAGSNTYTLASFSMAV
jgi:hypothetical protein